MKTVNELFQLIATATQENEEDFIQGTWFIRYSGHVNKLEIKYHYWKKDGEGVPESICQELDEEGIQSIYWFIKTRLKQTS